MAFLLLGQIPWVFHHCRSTLDPQQFSLGTATTRPGRGPPPRLRQRSLAGPWHLGRGCSVPFRASAERSAREQKRLRRRAELLVPLQRRGAREGCPLGSRRGAGAASWPHAFRDRDLFHLGRTWHYPERWEGTSGQDTWVSSRWPKKPGEPVSACSLWGPRAGGAGISQSVLRPTQNLYEKAEPGLAALPARALAGPHMRVPGGQLSGLPGGCVLRTSVPFARSHRAGFIAKCGVRGGQPSTGKDPRPPPAPGELCPCSASRGVFVLAGLSFRSAVLENLNV